MLSKPHDTGYKELFSHPEFVRELMLGFAPEQISQILDYGTLTLQSGNYITPLFKEKIEDCVWSIQILPEFCKNEPSEVFLFILLEFQSRDDKTMPLRMLHYTASFYHQLIKEKSLNLRKDKLPLVFPCVLYNGDDDWKTPVNFHKLLPTIPSFLKKYQIQQTYFLIDEKRLDSEALEKNPFLLSGIFNIEQSDDDESAIRALSLIQRKLASYPSDQRERFAQLMNRWVKFFLFKSALDIDSEDINFMEESPMSLRNYVLRQREEGRLEGIKESIINLHRNMKLAAEQIAIALQLPVEKVERILAEMKSA